MIEWMWVTEKPSAALSLIEGLKAAFKVDVVNRATSIKDGFWKLSNGHVVLPFEGHLLEMQFLSDQHRSVSRAEYLSAGGLLPIVVKEYKGQPRAERDKSNAIRMRDGKPIPHPQFVRAAKLMPQAKVLVNACDIDREGQRIFDEMCEHLGIDPCGTPQRPVYRLALVSARPEDIRRQVLDLKESNGEAKWHLRGKAALARALSDAALGYNASMAYQAVSGFKHASVGRVQTPVLGIVVAREQQIQTFKPQNYFVPKVTLADGSELSFHHREGAEGTPGFDEQGRIVDEAVAKRICELISAGLKGQITGANSTAFSETPPLPFSATVLASTVAKRTGMTPKQVEAAAKSLYERHKAISYIGTDCRFLPEAMLEDARATMSQLSRLFPQPAAGANLSLKSAAFNDSKVDEHFAIVPTGTLPNGANAAEQAVYDAVSRRYIAQFYPAYEGVKHRLAALFGMDEFRATRTETVKVGWKEVEGHLEQQGSDGHDGEVDGNEDADAKSERLMDASDLAMRGR